MWWRLPRTARGDEHELNPLLGSGRKPKHPEQTHPAQGECANSPHTEPGRNSNPRPWRGEASHPKVTHSADLREECRFVLLGGDDFVKYNACNFILRTGQALQGADLDDWQLKKNLVLGRHVTVAVSPSPWLERLKSTLFFSRGVKKIKNDIQKCVSGPHAFLLVIRDGRDPGKAHYLLKAVASVFGKEALDYSMALFIGGAGVLHSDPASMKCVKMCERRYHFLKDTDSSVQELFSKVENMVAKTKSKFFIPSAYAEFMEASFESWEKKRISDIKEILAKYEGEKDKLTEELNKMMDEKDKLVKELSEKLHASQQQNELKARFIFQQKTSRLSHLESEVTKKDSGRKCDNKKQTAQVTEERKRRDSKDTFLPNVSPE